MCDMVMKLEDMKNSRFRTNKLVFQTETRSRKIAQHPTFIPIESPSILAKRWSESDQY